MFRIKLYYFIFSQKKRWLAETFKLVCHFGDLAAGSLFHEKLLRKLTQNMREFFYSAHNQNGFPRKSCVALITDGGFVNPVLSRLGQFSLLIYGGIYL